MPGWLFARLHSPEGRLRRVLRAAARDPYYEGRLAPGPVPALDRFPFTDPEKWRALRRVPDLPEVVRHPLNRDVLAARPCSAVGKYTAIAGAPASLLELAHRFARCRPEVEFAVLALERPGDAELSELQRDQLWEAFQVPVYRLLLGFDGTLLGHECEALSGLHCTGKAIFEEHDGAVYMTSLTDTGHPSIRLRTGVAARLEHGPCDCGRPGLRLAPAWREQAEMSSAAD